MARNKDKSTDSDSNLIEEPLKVDELNSFLIDKLKHLPLGAELLKIGVSFYGHILTWLLDKKYRHHYSGLRPNIIKRYCANKTINVWLKSKFRLEIDGVKFYYNNDELLKQILLESDKLAGYVQWSPPKYSHNLVRDDIIHSKDFTTTLLDQTKYFNPGNYLLWLPITIGGYKPDAKTGRRQNFHTVWFKYNLIYDVEMPAFTGFTVNSLIMNRFYLQVRPFGNPYLLTRLSIVIKDIKRLNLRHCGRPLAKLPAIKSLLECKQLCAIGYSPRSKRCYDSIVNLFIWAANTNNWSSLVLTQINQSQQILQHCTSANDIVSEKYGTRNFYCKRCHKLSSKAHTTWYKIFVERDDDWDLVNEIEAGLISLCNLAHYSAVNFDDLCCKQYIFQLFNNCQSYYNQLSINTWELNLPHKINLSKIYINNNDIIGYFRCFSDQEVIRRLEYHIKIAVFKPQIWKHLLHRLGSASLAYLHSGVYITITISPVPEQADTFIIKSLDWLAVSHVPILLQDLRNITTTNGNLHRFFEFSGKIYIDCSSGFSKISFTDPRVIKVFIEKILTSNDIITIHDLIQCIYFLYKDYHIELIASHCNLIIKKLNNFSIRSKFTELNWLIHEMKIYRSYMKKNKDRTGLSRQIKISKDLTI